MTKIFKIAAISALAMVLAVGAFAQAAGPQGGGVQNGGQQGGLAGGKAGKAGGGLKQMQKVEAEIWQKLTPALSAEQKAKIQQIDQKTKDSYKALRAKVQNGDKASLKDEVQKIQTGRRDAIQALLSPEQKKSYQALAKVAMEKIRADRKKDGGGKNKIG
jgi:Spy/CpxP family protein refolding chaperone